MRPVERHVHRPGEERAEPRPERLGAVAEIARHPLPLRGDADLAEEPGEALGLSQRVGV